MSNGPDPACPCTAAQDPQVVSNPPGLPAISYRVDDFTGFRRALLRPLPGEQAIGAWRPAPGDLGLQVLEWWAYLADILTFYNERIANESYLRTASSPAASRSWWRCSATRRRPGSRPPGRWPPSARRGTPPSRSSSRPACSLSSTATPGVPAQTFEVDAPATFTGASNVPVTLPPDTALQRHGDGTPHPCCWRAGSAASRPATSSCWSRQGGHGRRQLVAGDRAAAVAGDRPGDRRRQHPGHVHRAGGWGPTPTPPPPPGSPVRRPAPPRLRRHPLPAAAPDRRGRALQRGRALAPPVPGG